MKRMLLASALLALHALSGCRQHDPHAPPTIVYGESICARCGMIISDDRFGVATVVAGERGDETLLFDDFNCQFTLEASRTGLVVVRRWARDHGTREWIDPDSGWFVLARSLRTPMGSHLAAFKDDAEAAAFARRHDGQLLGPDRAREAVSDR